jgi:hypothetical protein
MQTNKKQTLETIVNNFPISNEEYAQLDAKFGNLAHYISWQLKKQNTNNILSNDQEDDVQELRIALMRAGSYYKRQTYIEKCFKALRGRVREGLNKLILKKLKKLWRDRRRHGANRQKFGEFQEVILKHLVEDYVPEDRRPARDAKLLIDSNFATYAKQIVWNAQKSLGKQITKEKSWRRSLVSLSQHDHLVGEY